MRSILLAGILVGTAPTLYNTMSHDSSPLQSAPIVSSASTEGSSPSLAGNKTEETESKQGQDKEGEGEKKA